MGRVDDEFVTYVQERLPHLRRAAYLLAGDWTRGDDILQRALTDAYTRWATVRRADNIDAYLRTILVHRWIDEQRRGWTARVRLVDAVPDRPGPDHPDLDAGVDVRTALSRLPPRQRAVLVLRFLCDMSVEETATSLRCSPGTVKSQTSAALVTMRRLLTPSGSEPA